MSVRIMTRVWDLELPDSDKIVMLALADCANDEGHCWPSVASLVRKCSKSERTIQASIKRLCEEGVLLRREVPGKGCNYTVFPRRPAEAAPRIDRTPAETAPPQGTTPTPAAAADKPSRTITTEAEASERAFNFWNEESEKSGLHKVRLPPDNSRKQQMRLRIKAYGLETMLEAIRRAHRSPFLQGKTGDGRKADINIILQPKTLARVLEGFYGNEAAEFTDADRIASLEKMIPIYEKQGRDDLAEESRRRIAELGGNDPPDPAIAAKVVSLVGSSAKNFGRVAAR